MSLLVAGGIDARAGKTTFAAGLVARTGAVGFKPRAGSNRWFHRDQYRRAVEAGRLYGRDAERLAAASPGDLAPESINAVHRLWQPTPGRSGPLGLADRTFVCDRAGEHLVVNAGAELPAPVREHLPVGDAVEVSTLAELNRAVEEYHLPALADLAERVAATDRAVVESYDDVARPVRGVEPDAVAVVEPARLRVYDGERYRRACEVAGGTPGGGQLEERVGDAVDLADPVARVPLPPLSEAERTDPSAVADAYADAYGKLLAAAGW